MLRGLVALERTWAVMLERAAAMSAGGVDISVEGEWSFAQTLRHLLLATDMWLGQGIMELKQPFHPLGLMDGASEGGFAMSVFTTDTPTYCEVLEPGTATCRWCATSWPPSLGTARGGRQRPGMGSDAGQAVALASGARPPSGLACAGARSVVIRRQPKRRS
jgi:hypothetical protein